MNKLNHLTEEDLSQLLWIWNNQGRPRLICNLFKISREELSELLNDYIK